jgi:hypothetical protein
MENQLFVEDESRAIDAGAITDGVGCVHGAIIGVSYKGIDRTDFTILRVKRATGRIKVSHLSLARHP